MLEQNVNTFDTAVGNAALTDSTTAVAPRQETGTAVSSGFPASAFTKLKGAFAALGIEMPANACVSCTVDNGNIKFGENLVHNAGEFMVVKPFNFQTYWKINLGIVGLSAEERKLCANCYDGETVSVEEVSYTKDAYLALVKEKGYAKAKWEERGILHGSYIDSDNDAKVGEHLADDDILAVYLSPSSLKDWNAFLVKSALNQTAGYIRLGKVEKSYNGNKWSHFTFAATPAVERR